MKKFDIIVKQLPQVTYPAGEGFVLRPHQRKEYDALSPAFRVLWSAEGLFSVMCP